MKILLSLFIIFYGTNTSCQTRYLIPFRDGNLWGYADPGLKIVVPAKYDSVALYCNGYGAVIKNKRFGYTNYKGAEVVPPSYDNIQICTGNYLPAMKANKTGLIYAETGILVLPLNYANVQGIGNEIFLVTNSKLLKGLFNAATRKWLMQDTYDNISVEKYANGINFYVARRQQKNTYFSITHDGRFSLSKSGKTVLQTEKLDNTVTADSTVETLEEIIEAVVDSSHTLNACGYTENGKVGCYRVVTEYGLTTVDTVEAIYDNLRWVDDGFKYDLIIVRMNGKEGVISVKNKEIIPMLYDTIIQVKNNNKEKIFIVRKGGEEAMINLENKELIPFIYNEINFVEKTVDHGIFIVRRNGKFGLAKEDGLILPCEYDTIKESDSYFEGFSFTKDSKVGALIVSRYISSDNLLIEAKYDSLYYVVHLQESDFLKKAPSTTVEKPPVFLMYVSKDHKAGFIDFKGHEFFSN